jgi:protease II
VTTVVCDLVAHETKVTHVEAVLGGFQQQSYSSSLEWVVSEDGVKVPVTVAWRRELMAKDWRNPALLKA